MRSRGSAPQVARVGPAVPFTSANLDRVVGSLAVDGSKLSTAVGFRPPYTLDQGLPPPQPGTVRRGPGQPLSPRFPLSWGAHPHRAGTPHRGGAIARSDVPNERSWWPPRPPSGGGLAIVTVVLSGVAILWVTGVLGRGESLAILGGGTLVAVVGWLDDRRSLTRSPGSRRMWQRRRGPSGGLAGCRSSPRARRCARWGCSDRARGIRHRLGDQRDQLHGWDRRARRRGRSSR